VTCFLSGIFPPCCEKNDTGVNCRDDELALARAIVADPNAPEDTALMARDIDWSAFRRGWNGRSCRAANPFERT
jgi:hypothetical protein